MYIVYNLNGTKWVGEKVSLFLTSQSASFLVLIPITSFLSSFQRLVYADIHQHASIHFSLYR